jgi:hypothetical protein
MAHTLQTPPTTQIRAHVVLARLVMPFFFII